MSGHKLDDPPELVALCREGEDGEEQVAGWAMVLTDQVVGYIPDRTGFGAASYSFESLDDAEWLFGHSGIYPVRRWATVPHDLDRGTHHPRA